MKIRMKRKWVWGLALFIGATSGLGAVAYHKLLRWKRFEVVEPGVLYRSGILKDWQLEAAIDRYHFKTVFSFTHTNNSAERAVCQQAGVRRYYCYLHGNGVGPDDPYLRFLEVVQDPSQQPILVHCSAGVQRTGGAVALYRILFNDWSFDRAIDEMIEKGNKGKQDQIRQIKRISDRLTASKLANAESRKRRWQ